MFSIQIAHTVHAYTVRLPAHTHTHASWASKFSYCIRVEANTEIYYIQNQDIDYFLCMQLTVISTTRTASCERCKENRMQTKKREEKSNMLTI